MEIYQRTAHWKWFLGLAGSLIIIASLIYTSYVTTQLAAEEEKRVAIWAQSLEELSRPIDPNCESCIDMGLHLMIQESNTSIPIILVNEYDEIDGAINFGSEDSAFIAKELADIIATGVKPIEAASQKVYYKKSSMLALLEMFPYLQLGLIGIFIGIGYLAFSSSRRSEENRVWVGMAKETAHQLGTPISAIIGWIQHLQMTREDDEEVQEVVVELEKDVQRLELVAERFSKIGALPEMTSLSVLEAVTKSFDYMQRRAPRKVQFIVETPENPEVRALMHPSLFDWVLENLLRNALDAMEGEGEVRAYIHKEQDMVHIDISDTGKGIPMSKHKTIFKPGYSTKTRGWGLGLSLAKRIISEYHQGRIFVKKSAENEGTTFSIWLKRG